MKQAHGIFKMRRYMLQPGDGTRYNFFLVPLDDLSCICQVIDDGEDSLCDAGGLIRDISPNPEDFVTLGICMTGGQGIYEVRKSSLREPRGHFVNYVCGHMPGTDPYTVAAVVLACSVLVDEPKELEKACKAMLKAPELLRDARA